MSVSVSRQAGVHYRTKCLPHARALSFAAALAANARFEQVEVARSSRVRGEVAWFVTFRPVSEERQEAITSAQQESRADRALAQGSEYLWCRDKNGGRAFVWCLSTSGEVYEVTPGRDCTCPDFTYRCAGAGLHCKHLVALSLGLGTMTGFPEPSGSEGEPQ